MWKNTEVWKKFRKLEKNVEKQSEIEKIENNREKYGEIEKKMGKSGKIWKNTGKSRDKYGKQ